MIAPVIIVKHFFLTIFNRKKRHGQWGNCNLEFNGLVEQYCAHKMFGLINVQLNLHVILNHPMS